MTTTLKNGHFYGRADRPLEVGNVLLAETTYAAGDVVPLHAHAHPFFCLPLDGAFIEHYGRSRRTMRPRSAFFHPPDQAHAETFDHGSARLFNIQFGAEWMRQLSTLDIVLPVEHVALPGGRIPALALQLNAEYRMGAERLVVDGLLMAMLGELVRWRRSSERGARPGWLNTVVEAIHAAMPITPGIAELALLAQVHPSHLARTFRAAFGCTIGEYVRELRVRRSIELLRQPAVPLARIAADCGFADQSHFTRAFRASVGVTPAAYRRAVRTR